MDKFMEKAKEFFKKAWAMAKTPVTTLMELAEKEDTKRGCIKLAIISGITSLLGVIVSIISISSKYSNKSFWYKNYDSSKLADLRWKAIKDADLFWQFIKGWLIVAAVIAVIALVLFIIAKAVKSPKKYESVLSMANNTYIIELVGCIIGYLLGLIYAPIAYIVYFAVSAYAGYSLIYAYRDSLIVENTDKLVLITTGVFTAVFVILLIVLRMIIGETVKQVLDLNSLF